MPGLLGVSVVNNPLPRKPDEGELVVADPHHHCSPVLVAPQDARNIPEGVEVASQSHCPMRSTSPDQ